MAQRPRASALSECIAAIAALDQPAGVVAEKVRGLLPSGGIKDVLSGTFMGHARVGIVHAAANGTAALLYGLSLAARSTCTPSSPTGCHPAPRR